MTKRPLVVTPGACGARVAFAGGTYFEPVAEFDTLDAAYAVYRAATKEIAK